MSTDYIYSHEIDMFTFYRIPKALFSFEYSELDCEAKVLYGLLLDRASLSKKNHWTDQLDRVYIYFERMEAGELLGVKKEKTIKLFKELQQYDLIEDVRQGRGKANRIYVKKPCPEKSEKQTSGNPTSRTPINRPVEVGKTDYNYTNKNYIKHNNNIPQMQNFRQRKYDKNYFESLYEDV